MATPDEPAQATEPSQAESTMPDETAPGVEAAADGPEEPQEPAAGTEVTPAAPGVPAGASGHTCASTGGPGTGASTAAADPQEAATASSQAQAAAAAQSSEAAAAAQALQTAAQSSEAAWNAETQASYLAWYSQWQAYQQQEYQQQAGWATAQAWQDYCMAHSLGYYPSQASSWGHWQHPHVQQPAASWPGAASAGVWQQPHAASVPPSPQALPPAQDQQQQQPPTAAEWKPSPPPGTPPPSAFKCLQPGLAGPAAAVRLAAAAAGEDGSMEAGAAAAAEAPTAAGGGKVAAEHPAAGGQPAGMEAGCAAGQRQELAAPAEAGEAAEAPVHAEPVGPAAGREAEPAGRVNTGPGAMQAAAGAAAKTAGFTAPEDVTASDATPQRALPETAAAAGPEGALQEESPAVGKVHMDLLDVVLAQPGSHKVTQNQSSSPDAKQDAFGAFGPQPEPDPPLPPAESAAEQAEAPHRPAMSQAAHVAAAAAAAAARARHSLGGGTQTAKPASRVVVATPVVAGPAAGKVAPSLVQAVQAGAQRLQQQSAGAGHPAQVDARLGEPAWRDEDGAPPEPLRRRRPIAIKLQAGQPPAPVDTPAASEGPPTTAISPAARPGGRRDGSLIPGGAVAKGLQAEQRVRRRRGSPEGDGRAVAGKRRQRSPAAARRGAADTGAPTPSRCRAAAADTGGPSPSGSRVVPADATAPSLSKSGAAAGARPPSAGRARAAADASTASASKSRAAALQRGALEPSGEWCFAPPLQRGPSKLQAALWWHLPGYAEATGAVQLHVMWTGLVGSAWARAKSSSLPAAYISSPLAGSSFVPMSLRDWRSQRAQWDGHLMVVTAACPEPVQGQQLPCSGQGMRSEVRLAVLQKLLSCMPGWALSMRVTVPASSTGGPLAASIIITVPSAWTEDMITSLPQAHRAAVEGAISEAASTSQVGFLLAATLLQPGEEPRVEASACEGSSMGWSSLPLTFPGLTSAELNGGQAQPPAADRKSGDHPLAAPAAAAAAAGGVGRKRPGGSEAAILLPHLKPARGQPAEGDVSTPADSAPLGNSTPGAARGVGSGRLPNGMGGTDGQRSGKDRHHRRSPQSHRHRTRSRSPSDRHRRRSESHWRRSHRSRSRGHRYCSTERRDLVCRVRHRESSRSTGHRWAGQNRAECLIRSDGQQEESRPLDTVA